MTARRERGRHAMAEKQFITRPGAAGGFVPPGAARCWTAVSSPISSSASGAAARRWASPSRSCSSTSASASDHIAIRTSSYEGIEQRGKQIQVHGLNYIVKNADAAPLPADRRRRLRHRPEHQGHHRLAERHVAAQHPARHPHRHRLFQARQQPHRAPARLFRPRDRQVAGLSPRIERPHARGDRPPQAGDRPADAREQSE